MAMNIGNPASAAAVKSSSYPPVPMRGYLTSSGRADAKCAGIAILARESDQRAHLGTAPLVGKTIRDIAAPFRKTAWAAFVRLVDPTTGRF